MNVKHILEDYPRALKSLQDRHDEVVRTLSVMHALGATFSAYGGEASHITDRAQSLVGDLEEQMESLENEIVGLEDARSACLKAIGRLPKDMQVYLTRVHLAGMSQREAAASLNISRQMYARKYREALDVLDDLLAHL
jgi:DNA-directed RNA polymerase specialized sigma24 family protein